MVPRAAWFAAVLVFLPLTAALFHYTLDDTFIYLRYARNLAAGQGFAFNPGEPSYGFTSPLWLALLTIGSFLPIDPLIWGKTLSIALGAGSVLAFASLAQRVLGRPWAVAAATVLWAQNAWLVRWSPTAMETSLALVLVLAGLRAFLLGTPGGVKVSGVMFGLLSLVRPETGLLLPLGTVLRWRADRKLRGAAAFVACYLAAVLPWVLFAAWYFGTPVPNTVVAKSGASLSIEDAVTRAVRLATIVGAVAAAESLALAIGWGRSLVARREFAPGILLAFVLLLPTGYVVTGAVIVSRYVLLVVPVVILLGMKGVLDLAGEHRAKLAVAAVVAAGVLQNQWVTWQVVRPEAGAFTASLHGCFGGMGKWLADQTPPRAVVAAGDIGLLGYASDRHVFDLEGLVSASSLPLRRVLTRDEIVRDRRYLSLVWPTYVVDGPTSSPSRLRYATPPFAVPVYTCRMDSLGVAQQGDYHYTLYRLDYTP